MKAETLIGVTGFAGFVLALLVGSRLSGKDWLEGFGQVARYFVRLP